MTPAAPPPFRLLAIGDRRQATPEAVRAVAEAGGPQVAVLLRDGSVSEAEAREWAEALLPVCRAAGARLLVHRWPELARDLGADGLHLPDWGHAPLLARATLGPAALLGVSRHTVAGLRRTAGASYATFGPVHPTPGKGNGMGLEALAEACRASPVPVVAVGGITPEQVAGCREAGAAAVAAIRAVWQGDPAECTRALLAA